MVFSKVCYMLIKDIALQMCSAQHLQPIHSYFGWWDVDVANPDFRRQICGKETIPCKFVMLCKPPKTHYVLGIYVPGSPWLMIQLILLKLPRQPVVTNSTKSYWYNGRHTNYGLHIIIKSIWYFGNVHFNYNLEDLALYVLGGTLDQS